MYLLAEIISVNFLKNIHFLTQLNTPPEYPEYSNRAFSGSLNTPGEPPQKLVADELKDRRSVTQVTILDALA